ncbi:MAG: S-layer homology domain-containing protein [Clostridia bacterium]|nr:S-layer homology domain-containing protein [Clostridia bacterium]
MLKNFKRLSALMLAFAMIFTSVVVCATEERASQIEVDHKPAEGNAVIVNGTLDLERAGTDLILRFVKDGICEFVEFTKTTFAEDGKTVVYTFPDILLPNSLKSGKYTIEISGEELTNPITSEFEYNGADRTLDALTKIAAAKITKSVGGVITSNSAEEIPYSKILGITIDAYSNFSDNGKAAFEERMAGMTYTLPTGFGTAEDKDAISKALEIFTNAYEEAIALGLFADADSKADFDTWYDKYYKAYKFDKAPNDKITDKLEATRADDDFIRRITEATKPMTKEEVQKYLYNSALLSTIVSKTSDEIEDLLFAFDEEDEGGYFEGLYPESKYASLSSIEKAGVIAGIKGIPYDLCSEVVEIVNDLIDKKSGGTDNDDDDSSSGKGSGGRGNIVIPNTPIEENKADDVEDSIFNDLSSTEWAKTAIEYLYGKGVVNGKADGVYAPDDNVTRAEFIKIIVAAMGISGDIEDTPFTDVDEKEWYAPYIAAAYKGGVVLGSDNGAFYPNASITREDMATILYRALGVKAESVAALKFADAASVSDYAKEAVGFLTSKKIINGFEDGSFGPKKNATRAETAVMVYNAMTKGL